MSFWRTHPMFCSALIALGLVAVGEAWCLCTRARAARREQAKLEQRRREYRALAANSPAPTEENAARMEQESRQVEQALRDVERVLAAGSSSERLSQPAGRDDELFFGMTAFVAAMRERAARLGIELNDDERFGFSEFAHAGPKPAAVAEVAREYDAVQQVLPLLFAAGPKRLVRVERARRKPEPGETARTDETTGAGDYFDFDPGRSVASPGVVDTTGLRFTFDGGTDVLRRFLREVGRAESLLAVRSVEVWPVDPGEGQGSEERAASTAVIPLIRDQVSRFVVTVEAVRELSAARPPAE